MHNIPLLSGKDLIKILVNKFGYSIIYQKGSHVQLAIPNHKTIALGTMNSILRILSRHLNKNKNEVIKIIKEN